MPRSPRTDFAGAVHHVFNRGIEHRRVFTKDGDRRFFLDCLAKACTRHNIEVFAYCLLDNHFHILGRSQTGELSLAMKLVAGRFTQGFNHHHGRDGPVFRGRFKAVLIEADAQLLSVLRYIHRNPVEAGIVAAAEAWTWSSAAAYLGQPAPAWLNPEPMLAMFSSRPDRVEAYRQFVGSPAG